MPRPFFSSTWNGETPLSFMLVDTHVEKREITTERERDRDAKERTTKREANLVSVTSRF
jgi:hypothetical protein